jgi:hypothetical protein
MCQLPSPPSPPTNGTHRFWAIATQIISIFISATLLGCLVSLSMTCGSRVPLVEEWFKILLGLRSTAHALSFARRTPCRRADVPPTHHGQLLSLSKDAGSTHFVVWHCSLVQYAQPVFEADAKTAVVVGPACSLVTALCKARAPAGADQSKIPCSQQKIISR